MQTILTSPQLLPEKEPVSQYCADRAWASFREQYMIKVVAAWKKADTPMPVNTRRMGFVLLPCKVTTSAIAEKLPIKAENTTCPVGKKPNQPNTIAPAAPALAPEDTPST